MYRILGDSREILHLVFTARSASSPLSEETWPTKRSQYTLVDAQQNREAQALLFNLLHSGSMILQPSLDLPK
jgi:hypothetical protein